ncbi:MAG TPA: response regulator, partial [Nitrososphaeraceae archaeon]|nr:response regulator [Nitrososphaeraceae archaeon]
RIYFLFYAFDKREIERGVLSKVRDPVTLAKNILLVDDELDVIYTIKNVLEDNGFQIDSYNDPITALNSYRSNFYDLVILDIKMPKMDGFELYTKLKEKDPKVKICFLTAGELFYEELRNAQLKLGEKIGEEYFIQKPIKTGQLVDKINTFIITK